jgi:hypothetical protein
MMQLAAACGQNQSLVLLDDLRERVGTTMFCVVGQRIYLGHANLFRLLRRLKRGRIEGNLID